MVPAHYSKGKLFRKSNVQICATYSARVKFSVRVRIRVRIGVRLELVEIMDFRNSEPSE